MAPVVLVLGLDNDSFGTYCIFISTPQKNFSSSASFYPSFIPLFSLPFARLLSVSAVCPRFPGGPQELYLWFARSPRV